MPCLLVIIALAAPRFVAGLVFFLSDAFSRALPAPTLLWGLLGFFFAPFSLLAYTAIEIWGGGEWNLLQVIVMVVAVMMDLGAHRESSRKARQRGE